MKNIILSLIVFTIFNQSSFALESKKLKWGDIDVTYIEDSKLPLYNILVYFADGALSDGRNKGETKLMFDLLKTGTNRFSLKEIADNLEFYGTSAGAKVVHEYSTYNVSGMSKDVIPTMKKICHLFKDAVYPHKELKKAKKAIVSSIKNKLNSHGSLASMAFREINLEGSPFANPVDGKIKSIKRIGSKDLQKKLKYFNETVKKKVYITGPKSVLDVKSVLLNDCGWDNKAMFERKLAAPKGKKKGQVHFVTVPKANQAQVLAGKFLTEGEFEDFENLQVSSHFLGGGFTSVLMKELRSTRGLTYSAYAYAGRQKDYGRSVISTFTKNESVVELLGVLKDILTKYSNEEVSKEELKTVLNSLKGKYIFQFENPSEFINELLFFDHIGLSHDRIYEFTKNIDKMTTEDLKVTIKKIFPVDEIDYVILGDKSLIPTLKKAGYKNLKVHNYKSFL